MSRKPRTRANREGRVWQRTDGRWCARAYPPDEGAKPVYVYGRSREEAKDKRTERERELADGTLTGKRDATVGQFFEKEWLAKTLPQQMRAGHLAQSTLASYTDNARKHILPDLGGIPIRKLSVSRVRTWMDDLSRKPSGRPRRKLRKGEKTLPPPPLLSPRTIAYCHAILRRALSDAMRDEVVARNVATLVQPPKAEDTEREPLTLAETAALLEASSQDTLWCYWLTVLTLGLRRGEGLGLRWADIDFENKTAKLSVTVQRVRGEDGKGRLVTKDLKTKASKAAVAAGDGLLDAWREHQREQRRTRMRAQAWLGSGLVFTTSVGTALEPRNVNRAWDAVCDRAGVRRVHIHDLRHAFGTYLAKEGHHPKEIQAALRHSRMATTEIYVHALKETPRGPADTMDALVTSLRQAGRKTS